MSTVKISELTALSSADAADELVIVDDSAGVTKKITHANLANFGTRTVTAGAIDFSGLANAAGMTSEVLDDYEQGTWTPQDASSNNIGVGTYTKIGDMVWLNCVLVGAVFSTNQITNLPYQSADLGSSNYRYGFFFGRVRYADVEDAGGDDFRITIANNASTINFRTRTVNADDSGATITSSSTSVYVSINGFYRAA